jgi:hypothetical protein
MRAGWAVLWTCGARFSGGASVIVESNWLNQILRGGRMKHVAQLIVLALLVASLGLQVGCAKPVDTDWDTGKFWKDRDVTTPGKP